MTLDLRGRPLGSLRMSVTDRCNLRCAYCMPEEEYRWLQREALLSFEELTEVARASHALGVRKLRLTGGEPLLRNALPELVRLLSGVGFDELAMTSNGVLLPRFAGALQEAGLHRLTVSLDTLQPTTFERLTRRAELPAVLQGLEAAHEAGFADLKIDTVLLRGVNDEEVFELTEFAGRLGAEIRFIEYMDVGGATRWDAAQVVSQKELLERLTSRFGPVVPLEGRGSAPAQRFLLQDRGQVIGSIASVTQAFCSDCDRLRLTADGQLLDCLYARTGLDLRSALRGGQAAQPLIEQFWLRRRAQGAVERAHVPTRTSFISLAELRGDPRLEMHTRGG